MLTPLKLQDLGMDQDVSLNMRQTTKNIVPLMLSHWQPGSNNSASNARQLCTQPLSNLKAILCIQKHRLLRSSIDQAATGLLLQMQCTPKHASQLTANDTETLHRNALYSNLHATNHRQQVKIQRSTMARLSAQHKTNQRAALLQLVVRHY